MNGSKEENQIIDSADVSLQYQMRVIKMKSCVSEQVLAEHILNAYHLLGEQMVTAKSFLPSE